MVALLFEEALEANVRLWARASIAIPRTFHTVRGQLPGESF